VRNCREICEKMGFFPQMQGACSLPVNGVYIAMVHELH